MRPGREEVVAIMEASKEYRDRMSSILALARDPKRQFGTGEVQIARMGPVLIVSALTGPPDAHPILVTISTSLDSANTVGTQVGLATIEDPDNNILHHVIPESTYLNFKPRTNQVKESNMITGEERNARKMTSGDWDLLNGMLGVTEVRLRQLEVSQ